MGRRAVETPYFSFLDDDDEYMPGALDIRLSMLQASDAAAVAVTNGHGCNTDNQWSLYTRMGKVEADPMRELFQQTWLHNCNHLFRTSSVGAEYFEGAPSVLEWTWLAFRLSLDGKVVTALDVHTCRYNDTPSSLSKSTTFRVSRIELYDRMLQAKPGREIVAIIRRRKSSAWHEVSSAENLAGRRGRAIVAHVRSLTAHWSGLKYLPYSRHLLRPRLPAA